MRVIQSIQHFDLRMLLWCFGSRYYNHLVALAKPVSTSGDGYMQVVFPLLIWAALPDTGAAFVQLAVLAFLIERPLYLVLKRGCKRRRPPEAIPNFQSVVHASDQFSFPSGHTMAAFLLATLSYLYFGPAALAMYIWAAAVGCSRVILGVHFPTDILAGATLGCLLGSVIFYY